MKADLGTQIVRREWQHTILSIGAYLIALLALAAISLYPSAMKNVNQKAEIREVENNLKVQQVLHPLFVDLIQAEKAACLPDGLKYVQPLALPRVKLLGFQDEIIALAGRAGVSVVAVEIKAGTTKQKQHVLGDAVFSGDFLRFRQLLLGLGQLSWMDSFRSIEVLGLSDQEQLSVQFELAVD